MHLTKEAANWGGLHHEGGEEEYPDPYRSCHDDKARKNRDIGEQRAALFRFSAQRRT
jgi:hypothetical protein